MPPRTDVLSGLEPLFAAERDQKLDSMESGVHFLASVTTREMRATAAAKLARDAHALKGAAQMSARRELCNLTDAFEARIAAASAAEILPVEVDLLLRTVQTLRSLSQGLVDAEADARALLFQLRS